MRICMVTSSYPRFEGDIAGTFVKCLCEYLVKLGHEVHVLAPYDPAVRKDDRTLVRVHRFRYVWADSLCLVGHARSLEADVRMKREVYWLMPFYLIAGFWQLLRLNLEHRFDVIHAHWVAPSGFIGAIIAMLCRLPLVVSLHGSDIFVVERNHLFAKIAQWVFNRAKAVIACSNDLAERAERLGLASEKEQVIPYGVDVRKFCKGDGKEIALREKLGIDLDEVVVLGLGRLVYKKGFEYLVRAVPPVIAEFEKVKFIIVGAGPLQNQLRSIAKELGISECLLMPGLVSWDEVPQYMDMCDVFVVPSIKDQEGNVDGLPNVLLEAMALGKPVVASRIGGIPAVLQHERNGLLVDEKDPQQLATAINRLLLSPGLRKRYGSAGREKAKRELNWENIVQATMGIYKRAIEPRSK
jgi:glycosyltransferase involved in cell wall biosynthesis